MNEKITKIYKNGMVTLDAMFFNVYQETIDSYMTLNDTAHCTEDF